MESRLRLHHSLAEGNFDNISNCLQQFTGYSLRLTPSNVVMQLDNILLSCWQDKLPVYIQVPSNIMYLEIDVPAEKLVLAMPKSEEKQCKLAVEYITKLLTTAKSPMLLVDVDADRCNLAQHLYVMAKIKQIPYMEARTGKGIMPEHDPLYLGIFNGKESCLKIKHCNRPIA